MHKLIDSATPVLAVALLLFSGNANALPDWSQGAVIPPGGRANIYDFTPRDFEQKTNQGKLHAQIYPVAVTGVLPPYEPFRRLADANGSGPVGDFFNSLFVGAAGIESFDGVMKHLGLHPYPQANETGVYQVPYPNGSRPESRLGFGLIERDHAQGFTFSCAACHSSNLFGKTVLGLSNRFPRANSFFVDMKPALKSVNPFVFQMWTGASDEEMDLFGASVRALDRVTAKAPIVLGLDTSLAQVALSLKRRAEDPWASPSHRYEKSPRPDRILDHAPADSKPAVWWNVKYKNRWLSDGSVLSGNPIFTNLIWNEVGRGTDLRELESWLAENSGVVESLTAAVFASEAPRITDFFAPERVNLARAKAGEKVFESTCTRCHGHYEKAWNLPHASALSLKEQLATTLVRMPAQTFVVDVGTDPYRRRGMKSLEALNALSISQRNGIVIAEQPGYVPPPLVGIWARWPYFHNNSAPDLCAVLTRSSARPRVYYSGEALDPARDFDFACNGYPRVAPEAWRTSDHLFDTSRAGLSNSGHDEGIFLRDGRELLSAEQKRDLIQFLQTL